MSPISVAQGVLQGDTLAPFLFILVIDAIIRSLPQEAGVCLLRGRKPTRRNPTTQSMVWNNLAFADDICLVASTGSDVQKLFLALEKNALSYGLKLNYGAGKTGYYCEPKSCATTIKNASGRNVPLVDDYNRLCTKSSSIATSAPSDV